MADAPGSLSEKPPCPHLRLSPDAAGPALDRRRLTFSCPWGLKPKDPSPTGWRGGSCTSRAWLPGMWHEALGCHSGEGLPSHRLFPCPVLGLAGNLGLNPKPHGEPLSSSTPLWVLLRQDHGFPVPLSSGLCLLAGHGVFSKVCRVAAEVTDGTAPPAGQPGRRRLARSAV